VPVIVEEHLVNGRPVEHLRFHPLKPGGNKLKRNSNDRRLAGQTDGCRAAWPVIPYDDPHAGVSEEE
jgi:hypothetical protein